ncbi:MAG: DUF1583 domain-containing protein [Pirellulaceae bacterium]|nr:DUF1583 domain-containing protein [Pirellulaceae bacterium]
MISQAIAKIKKQPKRNFNNADYEAYQHVRTMMSMIDMLASIDYPTDALRIAREFDRSSFAKAGQFQRNLEGDFDKKQKQLLEAVRKLGGLPTAATMIEDSPTGANAVDFGITYGERPFSERGIQSLWIDLIEEAEGKPEQAEALEKLVTQLKTLSDNRKLDDSAHAAWAIAADVAGDGQPLRQLLANWGDDSGENVDLKLRRRLFTLAALRLYRGTKDVAEDIKLLNTLATNVAKWDAADQLPLFAELGRQALVRKDLERAKVIWGRTAKLSGTSPLQALDLAIVAANADFVDLSIETAIALGKATGPVVTNSQATSKTGSLGELLGSNRRGNSGANANDEPDSVEVQVAKRIMELDDTWSNKKIPPSTLMQPLLALTLTEGRKFRPLFTDIKVESENLTINSVFDRLAKRAHQAKQTNQLLEQLKDNTVASHLLAVMALVRDDRPDEAKVRLEAIDSESLNSASKELVLQTLLLALDKAPCRKRAVELGLALLDQNKPSERYAEIEPFDTFAMILMKQIINHGMRQEFLQSASTHYLELTQHDNDRYSGSYGFQRRASQLEEMAKLFLNRGNTAEALKYLGMRQPVFNTGNDQSLDWVGAWALESLQSNRDRKYVYGVIADWTFSGDGALNYIKTLSRRQRLPAWIPESVGGNYPNFPVAADPLLPITTNYYFLAKLAQETQQVDDLKQRYTTAIGKERAGAVEGFAIALATWNEPIPVDLLTRIDKRLDSIDPGRDRIAKSSMPLAEAQLASILASDANHAQWAKATLAKAIKHAHPLDRGYLHPWLSRYQYLKGWSEGAKLQPTNRLEHWIGSTSASAHDYYEGDTPAIWVTDGEHRIDHVCGFGADFMWVRYPLQGNFEFEVELPSGGWRESGLWCDGVRVVAPATTYVDVQGDENRSWARYTTQAIKGNEWNKYSVKLDGDTLTYSINGTAIYRENRKLGAPWLAFRAQGTRSTQARNIKLIGTPTIPRSVDLIQNEHMRGWTGVYYGQPLPSILLDNKRQEGDSAEETYASNSAKAEEISELSWTVKDSELISGKSQTTGPGNQSVVQYQRPLGEGESLTYEFFYEAGKTEVHPTIGRTAFMLRPDGLKLHWMTEPNTSWRTPADFEIPVPGIEATPLPLKSGEWNRIRLERTGQTLTITLNDEKILNQPCELAQGEVFGLFHYADKTSVRVRNARLEGPWPTEVPEKLLSTTGK